MRSKPAGWLPTRPSRQQLYILRHMALGWKPKLHGTAFWNSWWALRRRDLVTAECITAKGRAVLAYFGGTRPESARR